MAVKTSGNKFKSPNKKNDSDTEDQKPGTSQDTQETKRTPKHCKKRSPKKKPSPQSSSTPSTSVVVPSQNHERVARNLMMPMVPTTFIPVTTMATIYTQYQGQNLSYSLTNWNTAANPIPVPNPIYRMPLHPMPVVVTTPMMASVCPYAGTYVTRPMLPPIVQPSIVPSLMVPQPVVYEEYPSPNNSFNSSISLYSPEQTVPATVIDEFDRVDIQDRTLYETVKYRRRRRLNMNTRFMDPLESYLSLPRNLFPTARMLALDPNPIIDTFCKIDNIHGHAPWILDLEFGVPRVPVTRQIAIYDVKYNSVHCKNTPSAIHPGFESCSEEFKSDFRFYYDYVTSSWYRGYITLNNDRSVDNFQSWLLLPMQIFGMCWP